MLATIPSAVLIGVDGRRVSVEVHVSNGLPGFTVVGLPDAAVRESRDRVRAALLSSGLSWPLRRVTVNLAPSGVRKGGAGLDLPIAVGLLVASGSVDPAAVAGLAFSGELGLDGAVRAVAGAVVIVEALRDQTVVVPMANLHEARLAGADRVRSAGTLRQLVDALEGRRPWPVPAADTAPPAGDGGPGPWAPRHGDLSDVRGQRLARRALEVAATGEHHILLVGPPGSGKTMLASRLPDLLPPLDHDLAFEVSRIHSVAGLPLPPGGLVRRPPFRSPHHGASPVSMIGGGTSLMRPGEISLAQATISLCYRRKRPHLD